MATSGDIKVSAAVKNVYKEIQKASGSIGGNGHNGPIYGELTMGTFQKVVNYLRDNLDFGPESMFLDIGSGLGKPNFHAAVDPGVRYSFGIELEELRWQLSMHNLRHCFQKCPALKQIEASLEHPNIFFAQADATDLGNFSPFTHIYMFDTGFPPDALVQIANSFNMSRTVKALVSFTKPLHIIKTYGFAVELMGKIQCRMSGSSEGHTAYIYRSLHNTKRPTPSPTAEEAEPIDTQQVDPVEPAAGASISSIASRVQKRSPVKQKRRQQLQLDKNFFPLSKKKPRTHTPKFFKSKSNTTGEGEEGEGEEPEGGSASKPQVLFPVATDVPPPLFQEGFEIMRLPHSASKSPYAQWLKEAGVMAGGRTRRPSAKRVLQYGS